jgi:hypothetical protein
MTDGGLPQLDVARVQRWCANQVPEHIRSEIRVECDVAPRHLTICECRPLWREDLGPDWTRFPIARLHYTRITCCCRALKSAMTPSLSMHMRNEVVRRHDEGVVAG